MNWRRIICPLLALLGLGGVALFAWGLTQLLRNVLLGLVPILVGAFCTAFGIAALFTHWLCHRTVRPTALRHVGDLPGPSDTRAHPHRRFPVPPLRLWLEARLRGHRLPLWELCSMLRRGTPARIVVEAFIILNGMKAETPLGAIEDIYITERHRIHDAFDLVHIILGVVD